MQRHRILAILSACTLPFIATVCGEPGAPRSTPAKTSDVTIAPEAAITDGRDQGGVPHFYFLQPVDSRPKGSKLGAPDRTLEDNLALEICLWTNNSCAQPLLARYTSTSGVGKERLQLDDDDDYYKVRWYTSRFPSVAAGQIYRLTVLAAGIPIGNADVQIVARHRDLKNVDDDNFVGLRDDDGLTVRFYIEKCGVYIVKSTGGSATPCASGSILATANEKVALIVPANAVSGNIQLSIKPATAAPVDAGLVSGAFEFGPSGALFTRPLTLSMKYDPTLLPGTIMESTLGVYEAQGGVWIPVPGATLDPVRDRVAVPVSHFSQYGVLVPVASLALTTPAAPMAVGATAMATAVAQDAAGRALQSRKLEWSVFPMGIITIDQTGKITAVAPGQAAVTVMSEGQKTAATVTVGAPKAATVTVDGNSAADFFVGATRQLSATARDAAGNVLAGRTAAWSSSSDALATVDANGLVTAKAPGNVTITAIIDGVSGTAAMIVKPLPVTSVTVTTPGLGPLVVGETRQFTANAFNGTTPLLGRVATWTSSNDAIASVDANGLVTGKAPGDVIVTAMIEGIGGTASLTVKLPTITAVNVAPPSASIFVNATQQLTATAMAGSAPQSGRATAWSSSNDAVATVDASGLVSGRTPGNATITATVEGVSGTSAIEVKPLPVTSVTVSSAASGPLDVGSTRQFTAAAFNGSTPLSGRTTSWSSSNESFASVDANGLVTAKAPGDVVITATIEGINGTSSLTIKLPTITSVMVSPPSATLVIGATQQLVAKAMAGTVEQPGRATAWSSSNDALASVDGSGLVTAKGVGDVTITATVEGVSGTSAIKVELPKITSVSVTPPSATILVGNVQQLIAHAMAGSDEQAGRAVSWGSSDESIATVDGNGLVTGRNAGDATITASVEGVSGASRITVDPVVVPVTSVVVSSVGIGPLPVGDTRQFTAAAYNGTTPIFGRPVTWSSSDTRIATVDGNGFVTAVSGGSATIMATVDGVAGTSVLATRSMIFGPYHMAMNLMTSPFTGGLRELKPTDGKAMLDSARRAGMRLIIRPVSGSSKFQDPVTGRFRLDLWKLQVDRFRGWDFSSYIADGTIAGIYLIDEPMDPSNWENKYGCMTDGITLKCLTDAQGDTIWDAGEPVTFADIDAAAAYARQYFPGVPMGVGSRPSQLQPGAPFQYLEFGLAQYTDKKKRSDGTTFAGIGDYIAYEVAAARQSGLGLQIGINVIAGYRGGVVPASVLRDWGIAEANEPYSCALTLWKWDVTDGTGAPYNSYWTDPSNIAALADIAAAAARHAPVPCRPH